jgi:hypothetical protein
VPGLDVEASVAHGQRRGGDLDDVRAVAVVSARGGGRDGGVVASCVEAIRERGRADCQPARRGGRATSEGLARARRSRHDSRVPRADARSAQAWSTTATASRFSSSGSGIGTRVTSSTVMWSTTDPPCRDEAAPGRSGPEIREDPQAHRRIVDAHPHHVVTSTSSSRWIMSASRFSVRTRLRWSAATGR